MSFPEDIKQEILSTNLHEKQMREDETLAKVLANSKDTLN